MTFDLIVAIVIAVIAIVIYLLYQLGNLPRSCKRSILYLISAAAAIFGISLFTNHRLKLLHRELKEREEKLRQKEEELRKLKEKEEMSEKELNFMKAKLEQQIDAYRKLMLQIKAKNKAEKERIDRLSGEDLHNEFIATFGGGE
ncbi:hypothetical protein B6D60_03715 [candidate division KSB1 bacterium 4484_87]|nr:MAG: hypothetical protein B6D60_03715 [candidate division KSB1 bacterium 4484_87]